MKTKKKPVKTKPSWAEEWKEVLAKETDTILFRSTGMANVVFESIVNARLESTKTLLIEKGKEYVRNNNRFHNFNRAAEMNRETPTRALHGMLTKHIVSYLDMLDDIDKGNMPTMDLVNEKFGDIIVYFCLQEALIKSKIDK